MRSDLPALLTTAQAAALCRVKPGTIRLWVHRRHLDYARDAAGDPLVDDDGLRLFRQLDVARAEHATRERANRDLHLLVRIGAHA